MAKKTICWELQHMRGEIDEIRDNYINKNHCALPVCFVIIGLTIGTVYAKEQTSQNLPKLIMCAQCDSNIALIPGLPCFFVLQFVFIIIHGSGRVTLLCIILNTNQRTKSKRPGNKAVGSRCFSGIYYCLLSYCSFLKSINHNVLNAVTWHQ